VKVSGGVLRLAAEWMPEQVRHDELGGALLLPPTPRYTG
jgi:hypothetical protein